ncbi:MAG: galactose-1-phosphate uridylyltransferase [Solirubrobacteraceae bacterium]
MPELRIDPLSGLRTIIAPARGERPGAGNMVAPLEALDPAHDPFAAGNESCTPPQLDAAGGVRAVANRYPLLEADASPPAPQAQPELFSALPAAGAHEVIISSGRPVQTLGELERVEMEAVAAMWRRRMREHESSASYVHLMVNERPAGGASQPHSHAQLLALPFVPALVARERERFGAYATRTMGGNLLADLVQEEVRLRERIVAIDDDAVLLAPYASHGRYALMLAPRRPLARFTDDGPTGAALLHEGLHRLARVFGGTPPPLNLWIRTAPRGAEHFCWRIDIAPRTEPLGGVELGLGVHVCDLAPEQAAAELRAA